MNDDARVSDTELDALLAGGRCTPRAPDVVRARVLARARATVSAGAPAADLAPRRAWRLALAASLASLMGAAGAAAAVRGGAFARFQAALPARGPVPSSAPASNAASGAGTTTLAPPPNPIARAARPARQPTAQESYAAELALLQRTQVGYAARDFSGALVAAAEHARRFPNGRLAEFAARFPRSVLLPRLRQSAGTSD